MFLQGKISHCCKAKGPQSDLVAAVGAAVVLGSHICVVLVVGGCTQPHAVIVEPVLLDNTEWDSMLKWKYLFAARGENEAANSLWRLIQFLSHQLLATMA